MVSSEWGVVRAASVREDEAPAGFPGAFPGKETNELQVVVVDDHQSFRRALTSALRMVKGIDVAGEAAGGIEGAARAILLDPDLVVMDLSMPDLDGIESMRRIHKAKPELPVVILTAHADPGVEREAREAGAAGFVAKGTGLEDLVTVLRGAAEESRHSPTAV
jgi:two-component system nitrate/nitrite response regulator NarL